MNSDSKTVIEIGSFFLGFFGIVFFPVASLFFLIGMVISTIEHFFKYGSFKSFKAGTLIGMFIFGLLLGAGKYL